MSTEVTPELLRRVAAAWEGSTASDEYVRNQMRAWADRLEREQRPLPTVPGWYPSIVVERGGESCTGAFRDTSGDWHTPDFAVNEASPGVTIRWAEQDGKTPGQTLWDLEGVVSTPWEKLSAVSHDRWERIAAAVLAAHGTPTLTPVGEHPEPGARGLLPVVALSTGAWQSTAEWIPSGRYQGRNQDILADPRPDGAL